MRKGRYIQITVYVLLLIAAVFLTGIFKECSSYHPVAKEGNSGGDTLDIAIIYGPRSLYMYQDSLGGLNYDLAQKFSSETKIPVKIWPVSDVEYAKKNMEEGSFDILGALPLDNNIREQYLTSESLYLDRLVLIQLKDSLTGETMINSPLDLNGKTVHISAGSPAELRLSNLSKEIGGKIEIMMEPELSDELLSMKVAKGEIPLAVVNEKTVVELSEDYPQLSYNNPISFTQFQVWLFNKKDSELVLKFEDWFGNFKESEEYRTLIDKY